MTLLDDIGERALHTAEVGGAGDEEEDRHAARHRDHRPEAVARADERPAEALDDARHRVQPENRVPRLAAHVGGEDARKEPDLDQERHDVLDVAVRHVERREPEADPERGHEREEEQARDDDDRDRPRREPGPADSEDGLLVAEEDVPPGEEEPDGAVAPPLAEPEAGPAAGRPEDLDRGLAHAGASTRSPTRSPRMSSSV